MREKIPTEYRADRQIIVDLLLHHEDVRQVIRDALAEAAKRKSN